MGAPSKRHLINKWSGSKKIDGTKKTLHYWSCTRCSVSQALESKHARDTAAANHEKG